jgi:hypothetical protein
MAAHSTAQPRRNVLDGMAEPQLIIRLGWAPTNADPLPLTPRRDTDDIIAPTTIDNDD